MIPHLSTLMHNSYVDSLFIWRFVSLHELRNTFVESSCLGEAHHHLFGRVAGGRQSKRGYSTLLSPIYYSIRYIGHPLI